MACVQIKLNTSPHCLASNASTASEPCQEDGQEPSILLAEATQVRDKPGLPKSNIMPAGASESGGAPCGQSRVTNGKINFIREQLYTLKTKMFGEVSFWG